MKLGLIVTRDKGSVDRRANGPAVPYHEALARFKKDFQSVNGIHETIEEAWLVPLDYAKRVRLVTKKQADEAAKAQAKIEAEAKAKAEQSAKPKAKADAKAEQSQTELKLK